MKNSKKAQKLAECSQSLNNTLFNMNKSREDCEKQNFYEKFREDNLKKRMYLIESDFIGTLKNKNIINTLKANVATPNEIEFILNGNIKHLKHFKGTFDNSKRNIENFILDEIDFIYTRVKQFEKLENWLLENKIITNNTKKVSEANKNDKK